jgi:leader peptidase (prepilin peptidase) / N-methyltransferase
MFEIFAGLFGLLIGSFLNVCIYRWPRDLSVVSPRSHCPECEQGIAWFDNVPVLSYLLLRGKCRHCATSIPWRYPAVEIITGLLFAFLVWRFGLTVNAVRYFILCAMLVTLAFADAETRILPDEFTLGGLVVGAIFAAFVPVADSTFRALAGISGWTHLSWRALSLGEAALGIILPAGSLWLGGWLFQKIRHKDGLGFGDVKMMAMVGAFLGVRGTLLTLILGSLLGSVIGIIYIKATKQDMGSYELPFGTFLAAAAVGVALIGGSVIDWYSNQL